MCDVEGDDRRTKIVHRGSDTGVGRALLRAGVAGDHAARRDADADLDRRLAVALGLAVVEIV
jgi:hypothetical protein